MEWKDALLIVTAVASPIAVVVTLRVQAQFSAWRHDQHEKRLAEHDKQIATNTTDIAVLRERASP